MERREKGRKGKREKEGLETTIQLSIRLIDGQGIHNQGYKNE